MPEHATDDVARPGESTAGLARPLLRPIALDGAEAGTGGGAVAADSYAQQAFSCSWNGHSLVVRLSAGVLDSIRLRAAALAQTVGACEPQEAAHVSATPVHDRPAAGWPVGVRRRGPSRVRPRRHQRRHVVVGHLLGRTFSIHQVAPADSASWIGPASSAETAMSNPSSEPRSSKIIATARSSCPGAALMRNRPSYLAARRTGRAARTWSRLCTGPPGASLGAEPHGHPRLLHRPGKEANTVGDEVRTTMLDLVGHQLRGTAAPSSSSSPRSTGSSSSQSAQLPCRVDTEAEAQHNPPGREVIQGHDLARAL